MMRVLRIALLLFMLVGYLTAFPAGAPANICGRYVPGGHRNMGTPVANGPRTGPFVVEAKPAGNGMFTVTLRSTSPVAFRGYVIQAMQSWKQLPEGPSDIVGSFQPDFTGQSQVRSCGPLTGSNVLTHTSRSDKRNIQATWQMPVNLPDPTVKFVAAVIQDFDTFYVVHSDPINVQDGSSKGTVIGSSLASGPSPTTMTGIASSQGGATGGMTGTSLNTASTNTAITGSITSIDGTLGGGIPVVPDTPPADPVRVELFSPDPSMVNPPPPIVLPTGELSLHTLDNASPVKTESKTIETSASFTPVLLTDLSSTISQSESFLASSSPSISSDTASTLEVESPFIPSDSMLTSPTVLTDKQLVSDTLVVSPPVSSSISSPSSSSSSAATALPVNDPTISSFTEAVESATTSLSTPSIGSVPSLNIVDTNVAAVAHEASVPSINILDAVDPDIRVIEIPILPEGQRAALLDVTRGSTGTGNTINTSVRTRPAAGAERTTTTITTRVVGNTRPIVRPGGGNTQGQANIGQGQFNQGQIRNPFTGNGNTFGRPQPGGAMNQMNQQGNGAMAAGQGQPGGNGNFFNPQRFPPSRFPPGTSNQMFGNQNMRPGQFGGQINGRPGQQQPAGPFGGQGRFQFGSQGGMFGMQGQQGQTNALNGGQPGQQGGLFGQFGGQGQNGGPFGPQGQFGGQSNRQGAFGGPRFPGQGQQFMFGGGPQFGQFQTFRQFQGGNGQPFSQFRFGQFGPNGSGQAQNQLGNQGGQTNTQGNQFGTQGGQQGNQGTQGQPGNQGITFGQQGTGTQGQGSAMQGTNNQQPNTNTLNPFGVNAGQFGQPTGQFGQPTGQFGQPTGQFGQPTGQFGQPTGQFGQPTGQFGQPTGQFGQPTGQFGQPTGQLGQPTGQFGQNAFNNFNRLFT